MICLPLPEIPKKVRRPLLCRLFGCKDKFVRSERFDGLFGNGLSMTYKCKRCGTETITRTETIQLKVVHQ